MDAKSLFKKLSANGKEILSRTPLSVPLGFKKPQSISEQIAEFVSNQRIQEKLEAAGFETFKDAEDFEIGEDYEKLPESKYEADFDNIKTGLALERERARKSAKQNSSKPAVGAETKSQKKTTKTPPKEAVDESVDESQ